MINRRSFMLAAAGTLPVLQFPSLSLAQTGESAFELVARPAQKKLYRADALAPNREFLETNREI